MIGTGCRNLSVRSIWVWLVSTWPRRIASTFSPRCVSRNSSHRAPTDRVRSDTLPTLLQPRYLKPCAASAIVAYIVPALVTDDCLVPAALHVVASIDAVPDELLAMWRPLLLAWHRQVSRSVTVALLHALVRNVLSIADGSIRAALPTVAASAVVTLSMAWFTQILFDPDFDLTDDSAKAAVVS
jgi:hypothetical protein